MLKALKNIYNFNSSRFRLFEENKQFAESIPAGALVLDAGAGSQPYRKFLEHTQYESADFEQVDKPYAKSTYVCDLSAIPVEDNRFDYILFNQVMEHLPEPKKVLRELNRVLKAGGHMIYTGPLFYEEHEQPYDFYRYTQFSLKLLFSETGFSIQRIDWMEGYYGAVGYQLNRMAKYLPMNLKDLGGGLLGVLMVPVMLVVKVNSGLFSVFFHRLEKRTKYTSKGYPKNYVALVTKA
ncbi:MAG: class I SAM-dependent methyltransferase [Flavobacteriales bacterium]